MKHEIASIETAVRRDAQHREAKTMHRVHCSCGRIGGWYFSKATARELFGAHQRAASARDASQALADRVTGAR